MASKRPAPSATPPTPSTPSTSGSTPAAVPRGLLDRRGNPSAKGARLPSIRAPRDLTLGGVTKKTFVPNIPARREKKEDTGPERVRSTSARGRGGRDRPERGRGRGRGRPEIIQSHSIFEQGPAQERTKVRVDLDGGGGERSGGARVNRGTGGRRAQIKSEPGESGDVLDKLLRDDFIDDGESVGSLFPTKLPMSAFIEDEYKLKTENEDEQADEVKKETDAVAPMDDREVKGGAIRAMTPPTSCSMVDIFMKAESGDNDQLLFFQMPDVLPGFPTPPDEDGPRKKNEDQAEMAKNLSNFTEGKIGKIQILKSGRVRLLLGSSALDMNVGTPCSFLQSLVSVNVREADEESVQSASGDMVVLGQVKHRLVCTPDFLSMLQLADTTHRLGDG